MAYFPFDKWIRWLKQYVGEGSSTISSRVDTISSGVANNGTAINTVSGKVDDLTADVASATDKIDQANSTLENGTYGLAALSADIASATDKIDDLTADVAVVDGKVASATDKIDILDTVADGIAADLGDFGASSAQAELAEIKNLVTSISTSSGAFSLECEDVLERPDSGTTDYIVSLVNRVNGLMADLDANPTLALDASDGTDLSGLIYNDAIPPVQTVTMTKKSTGYYQARIRVASSTAITPALLVATGVLNANTLKAVQTLRIDEWIADTFTSADRANLDNVEELASATAADVDSLITSVGSATDKIDIIDGVVDGIATDVDAANTKLDDIQGSGFASGTDSLHAIASSIGAIEGLPIVFETTPKVSNSISSGQSDTVTIAVGDGFPSVAALISKLIVRASNTTHKFDIFVYKDSLLTKLWYDDYGINGNNDVQGVAENLCGLPFINADAEVKLYVKVTVTAGSGAGTYTVELSGQKAVSA